MKHSDVDTVRYKFDCEKKLHLKMGVEKDGSLDFRVVMEKNGSCEACVFEFTMNIINRGLQEKLTVDIIRDEAKGFTCPHAFIRSKSCIDSLARDLTHYIDERKAKNV